MLALPATGLSIPLWAAASSDIALSKANGPSIMHPFICPLSFILESVAASSVAGILGLTTSTAQIGATFGFSIPIACATVTEFLTISIFSSNPGYILKAESVIITNFSNFFTSNTAIWDIIFPVLNPISLFKTALKKFAVSINPFITISAFPDETISTAFKAAFLSSFSFTTS